MMFTRTVQLLVAQLVVCLLLSASVVSCVSPPEYPDTPSIEFKSATVTSGGLGADFILTLVFKDGDGDLGLSDADRMNPPFQPKNQDSTVNRFNSNYFIKIFKREADGTFQLVPIDSPGFDGAFDYLAPTDKPSPIRGDLRYKISIAYGIPLNGQNKPGPVLVKGDVIRFDISIADRNLHESNTVTTDAITLP